MAKQGDVVGILKSLEAFVKVSPFVTVNLRSSGCPLGPPHSSR
jgi:hypothetical protein